MFEPVTWPSAEKKSSGYVCPIVKLSESTCTCAVSGSWTPPRLMTRCVIDENVDVIVTTKAEILAALVNEDCMDLARKGVVVRPSLITESRCIRRPVVDRKETIVADGPLGSISVRGALNGIPLKITSL
jgi:hypothetical protein